VPIGAPQDEVLSLRHNQKHLILRRPRSGRLAVRDAACGGSSR
jgi:hypothetical protein